MPSTETGSPGRVLRDVTLPLIRFGLVSSWLLCFMIFVREYATGVYLQGPGTEVLGPLIVTLFGGGSLELVAALSVVNVVLVAAGLTLFLNPRDGLVLAVLLVARRRLHFDFHHEPVLLRLRQRVGALGVGWVLRREDREVLVE